ncbi:MAG: DUF1761 domain-containing protein [Flavobacteriales bacterium]|nr:DUF1761 domain-containing protein [Flavobacteriales bacterium]
MNWIAIIVAALASFVLGFVWYHPKLFGTAWMKSMGLNPDEPPKGNMAMIFGVAFLMAVVISYNLNQWAAYHPAEDQNFMHGAFHALLTCVMSAIPVLITNSLYEQRSWTGILINVGYWVAAFCLMGGILYSWPQPEIPQPEGEAMLRTAMEHILV